MDINFLKNINIKEEWRNMNWLDLDRILPEYHKERLAICGTCEHLATFNRCGVCGCFVTAKCLMDKGACPVGKW